MTARLSQDYQMKIAQMIATYATEHSIFPGCAWYEMEKIAGDYDVPRAVHSRRNKCHPSAEQQFLSCFSAQCILDTCLIYFFGVFAHRLPYLK